MGSPPTDIIAIHVGAKSKRTSFGAERQVLMSKSSYFRDLLSDRGVEEIEWVEMDPIIVEGILQWMKDETLGPLAIPAGTPMAHETSYTDRLLAAYREASLIKLCGFKNEVSDHMRTSLRNENQWPATSLLRTAYWKGLRGEPLTKLLMRCLVWQLRDNPAAFISNTTWFVDRLLKTPEIMEDLGAELAAYGSESWGYPCEETAQDQVCVYHDHSDGSMCGERGPKAVELAPPGYVYAVSDRGSQASG